MPSFSRCRAGILLSYSVYTGITINPGVGEVDQHPRRTFNYQGNARREAARKFSSSSSGEFRESEISSSHQSLSCFLPLSLFLPFSSAFYSCLLFRSTLCYFLSYGGVFYETRSREDQKIPIVHYRRGKFLLVSLTRPTFSHRLVRFRHIYFRLSLYLGEMFPIARKGKREGGDGHRSEWSPIIERRSHRDSTFPFILSPSVLHRELPRSDVRRGTLPR